MTYFTTNSARVYGECTKRLERLLSDHIVHPWETHPGSQSTLTLEDDRWMSGVRICHHGRLHFLCAVQQNRCWHIVSCHPRVPRQAVRHTANV